MSYEVRSHSGTAPHAVLAGNINATDLSFTVDNGAGYPDGSLGPFVVTFDVGLSTEEKALCDSRAGNVFTVNAAGRGWDGTTAQSHSSGTGTVDHTWSATEADEASQAVQQTLGSISAKGDLLSGTVANRLVVTPVGADGKALLADSTKPGGLAYGAPAPAAHDHSSAAAGGAIPESSVTGLVADLAARLPLSGGTMTGELTLAGDPSLALDAATRQYVDAGDTSTLSTAEAYADAAVSVEATNRNNADALKVTAASGAATDLTVSAAAAADKALTVKGAASQTGDLTEWQDSAATVLATVDKAGNAKFPNLAYAEAAGHIAIGAINPGSSNSGSISFPAGRFSQPPNIAGSCENNGLTFVMFLNVSTVGADFRVCNAGAAVTGSGTMRWHAVQMTSASADG